MSGSEPNASDQLDTSAQLGAGELARAVVAFGEALRSHEELVNRLNVYPVPDGDTGTNMALTVGSVVTELGENGGGGELATVTRAISHGSLMGARGNSGVILSQVLRGVAGVVADRGGIDAAGAADALSAGSDAAYAAVMKPVEGTILTVVRASAEGARGAVDGGSGLVAVLEAARSAAGEALDATPTQLAALAEAGVVDAGGTGYLLWLDALLHVADGRPLPVAPEPPRPVETVVATRLEEGAGGGDGDVSGLRYEVMYFLEAPDETIPAFKHVWAGIGDSIVVVGGDGIWNCHIHTDDVGAAIEAALDCGRPRDIRVTDLAEEVEEERWVREGTGEQPSGDLADQALLTEVATGVVAVCLGDGLQRILGSLGVHRTVSGGQSMNPSTVELIEAVEVVPATEVVILPNNTNIVAVANQVDANTDKTVHVVATRSIVEGMGALVVYDPEADGATNAVTMAEALTEIVTGEVTRAVRSSTCELGDIAEGDFLGMDGRGIRAVDAELDGAVCALLAELVGEEHEIVTLIEGEGASAGVTRRITEWLGEHHPQVAAEVHHGGQPLYPYYLSVE